MIPHVKRACPGGTRGPDAVTTSNLAAEAPGASGEMSGSVDVPSGSADMPSGSTDVPSSDVKGEGDSFGGKVAAGTTATVGAALGAVGLSGKDGEDDAGAKVGKAILKRIAFPRDLVSTCLSR